MYIIPWHDLKMIPVIWEPLDFWMTTQPNEMVNIPKDSVVHVDYDTQYMTDMTTDDPLNCWSWKYPMKNFTSIMASDQKDQQIQSNKRHHWIKRVELV